MKIELDNKPHSIKFYMPIITILSKYRDGDERGWDVEFNYLKQHHQQKLENLTKSILTQGIREPILLGDDHRIWDGHHRLCVAFDQKIYEIPVTFL